MGQSKRSGRVKDKVRRVRAFGEGNAYRQLVSAVWSAGEADGWQMAAITALLLRAGGAYECPGESGSSFVVMTDIRWLE